VLERGKTYHFLKKGQRNYWLLGEVPLVETQGDQRLSAPIASIVIIEPTHVLLNGEIYTRGTYKVIDIFDPQDKQSHFNGYLRAPYEGEKTLERRIS
jgi:hypothetical protein